MLAMASCNGNDSDAIDNVAENALDEKNENALQLTEAQTRCVPAINSFSTTLFKQLSGLTGGQSMVVSPISAAFTLGMLNEGANGETSSEITEALGLRGQEHKAVNELFSKFIANAPKVDKDVLLSYANMIAVNKTFATAVSDGYVSTVKDYYDASVFSGDFASPDALKAINGWCSEHSRGLIPGILQQLNQDAVMYLMNAVYFKASWADPFDKSKSYGEAFTSSNGLQTIKMMHKEAIVDYCEQSGSKAIRLPYGNGDFDMTIVLPADEDLQQAFDKLPTEFVKQEVAMALPIFTTEADIDLKALLTQMGVKTVFTERADLSRMTASGSASLYVSEMKQKTHLGLNEEGSEGGAVSEAELRATYTPGQQEQKTFYACRPFAYYISERSSGAILFIGQFYGN